MCYVTWQCRYIGEAIQKTGVAIEVGGLCFGCHCLGEGGSFDEATPCLVAVTCVVAAVALRLCMSLTESVAALSGHTVVGVFTFVTLC